MLLGAVAFALLPWYFPQNVSLWRALPGVFGGAETASGLVHALSHGRPWLWVALAALAFCAAAWRLPAGRAQGLVLLAGAGLGLAGLVGSGQGRAASLALILTGFALVVFFIQQRLLGRTSYTTMSGKGDSGVAMPLPEQVRRLCVGIAGPWLGFTLVVYVFAFIGGFVRSMTTVSAVIFLVTAENELATTYIIGRVGNGDYGVALSYCTVLIVLMSLATTLIQFLVGERQLGRRKAATP